MGQRLARIVRLQPHAGIAAALDARQRILFQFVEGSGRRDRLGERRQRDQDENGENEQPPRVAT